MLIRNFYFRHIILQSQWFADQHCVQYLPKQRRVAPSSLANKQSSW